MVRFWFACTSFDELLSVNLKCLNGEQITHPGLSLCEDVMYIIDELKFLCQNYPVLTMSAQSSASHARWYSKRECLEIMVPFKTKLLSELQESNLDFYVSYTDPRTRKAKVRTRISTYFKPGEWDIKKVMYNGIWCRDSIKYISPHSHQTAFEGEYCVGCDTRLARLIVSDSCYGKPFGSCIRTLTEIVSKIY